MAATRRHCLTSLAGGLAVAQLSAQVSSKADSSKLAMPGLYRGRVIAVANPASIVSGQFQREPIRQMIRKGMAELTGTDGGADAWRQFFGPGDVVGVKPKEIVVYDRYRKQFFDAGFHTWLPEGVRISHAAEDYQTMQMDIEGY